jgi:hypothetical protein
MSNNPSLSFDQKLLAAFMVGTFLQIIIPINGICRISLIICLTGILIYLSLAHRRKYQWEWKGIKIANLGYALPAIGFLGSIVQILNPNRLNISPKHSHLLKEMTLVFWGKDANFLDFLMNNNILLNMCFVFCTICFASGIFYCLAILGIVYTLESEFLKDCQNPDIDRPIGYRQVSTFLPKQQSYFSIRSITSFFTSRPFLVNKHPDQISIEFYKISSQDLRASWMILVIPLFFLVASVYGACMQWMLVSQVSQVNPMNGLSTVLYIMPVIPVIFALGISYFVFVRLFDKRINYFQEHDLIIKDVRLGRSRTIATFHREELIELIEKSSNTNIPHINNSKLGVRCRGRYLELAGQLLPESMETFQKIYNQYRTTPFTEFYQEINPIHIE